MLPNYCAFGFLLHTFFLEGAKDKSCFYCPEMSQWHGMGTIVLSNGSYKCWHKIAWIYTPKFFSNNFENRSENGKLKKSTIVLFCYVHSVRQVVHNFPIKESWILFCNVSYFNSFRFMTHFIRFHCDLVLTAN